MHTLTHVLRTACVKGSNRVFNAFKIKKGNFKFSILKLKYGASEFKFRGCFEMNDIYDRAIAHYGDKKQLLQACEECAELIQAFRALFNRLITIVRTGLQ